MENIDFEDVSYQEVFERQGIPEVDRTPANFFFYIVDGDSVDLVKKSHNGEVYAIPRSVGVFNKHMDGESHIDQCTLQENGAAISDEAKVHPSVSIGAASIVFSASRIDANVSIGYDAKIQRGTKIAPDSKLGNFVSIGYNAEIGSHAVIMSLAKIGEYSIIGSNVKLGYNTEIADRSSIGSLSEIGSYNVIGSGVKIHESVKTDSKVWIFDKAYVGSGVRLGKSCQVMEGVIISDGRHFRNDTLIRPKHFRRSRHGR